MRLSIIIPSFKDPYIHKTIDSILANAETDFEIIVVLDGYWQPFIDNPRIRLVHLGKNRGMREAINAGVRVARGEYLMRTDEHCMFAKGWDKEIISNIKDNEIMTARRYFLDPEKWEVMDLPPVDYEKLVIQDLGDLKKFTGQPWRSRTKERKDIMIDETMAMQGSFWIMKRSWWDKVIGELQTEGYGTMYQDSHEMVFKTWQNGGRLMVNKNTWFAHKHVSFKRTHNYGRKDYEPCLKYAYDKWQDYYQEIRQKWLV